MNAFFQLKSRIAFLAALLVAALPLSAQPDYVPSPEILKARSEFQDDKFGIMICWGIYSMMGDGEWMSEFGDTIYGTRSTAVPPQSWGVTTHKGNRMFVHIMSAEGNTVFIPYSGNRLKTATVFSSGENIPFKRSKDGITLQFKDTPADEIDYIVELTFADSI